MANAISNLAGVLRSLVWLAMLGILGTGGWAVYRAFDNSAALERELAEQRAAVERLTKENQRLSVALKLLKVDHRVAAIEVLDQQQQGERPTTRFQFVELGKDGSPIGEKKEYTVEGDMVYLDALVIKYDDALVEAGDPMRSTSVCLFRRLFGEYQEPSQGFAIDAKGSRPSVYSQGDAMSPFERDMWANFWQYANDPAKAKAAGVRAIHGEAPFIRLQPGKRYQVELRASGGLSIKPEDLPARPDA
jgi:hypothetical protein